ncbi:hypothetical protein PVK06_011674 [Gossypium arboreum]|uniref:Peptidase A2 domain-containing protein n=1 Tax=Gossypium arboreum TaxID=29729 RepID=A0ABR0Q9T0_GOSAR|nr:hypothetical protein PVK06_011674 [Gossypium arboreum]
MIERISGASTSKPLSTIEYMSSGDRLYFKNNAITNTNDNLVLPSNSQIEEEEDNISTNSTTPIGMKTVQIPIFPTEPNRNSRNTRMEEIQATTIIQQMKMGKKNDIITFSNFQPRKYYTYIEITFQFREYKTYSLHALLNTGATTSSCRENAIPVEKWELMKNLIRAIGIDGKETIIQFKARNIPIYINNVRFVIPKILCFPEMHGDILLGNNFIYHHSRSISTY